MVRVLLEHGADVRGRRGEAPFCIVSVRGQNDIAQLLQEHGAGRELESILSDSLTFWN